MGVQKNVFIFTIPVQLFRCLLFTAEKTNVLHNTINHPVCADAEFLFRCVTFLDTHVGNLKINTTHPGANPFLYGVVILFLLLLVVNYMTIDNLSCTLRSYDSLWRPLTRFLKYSFFVQFENNPQTINANDLFNYLTEVLLLEKIIISNPNIRCAGNTARNDLVRNSYTVIRFLRMESNAILYEKVMLVGDPSSG